MNIFEQRGIREVADVCLYSIELDENDNEIYIPVLYMDTLKVSTVEESTQQTSAQGGQGNPKLIAWDYGKDITVTLEDALFTPASNSMNWGAKLGAKGLQLHLRYFFDRNTDNNVPDTCLRTATLTAEKFSDYLIIPDRWPTYEDGESRYVGGTSIFCWMISGYISSDNTEKRVAFEDLILFYREQTQKWYFFNGKGPTPDEETWYITPYGPPPHTYDYQDKYFAIHYQYGREVFEWIRENIATVKDETNVYGEYEPVANATFAAWNGQEYDPEGENPDVIFLTQNLYIDGYRRGCAKHQLYSQRTDKENIAVAGGLYLPYRYFANIGVAYNTNVAPPQDVIYQIDTVYKDVFLIENIYKIYATRDFCIDTDINGLHAQYRYLDKYSQTPLTVFIDPKTMMPYQTNAFEFYKSNGERVTGNLRIIKKGECYYKWARQKAKENGSFGKQLIIDPKHYPGTYRLVGETYTRDRLGRDRHYQFEIPLCRLHADNKLSLAATGDPTVFSMKLTALRRQDGVMMKLTEYDLIEEKCPCKVKKKKIDEFISPDPKLIPESYPGDIDADLSLTVEAANRDIALALLENEYNNMLEDWLTVNHGFYKTVETVTEDSSAVNAKLTGTVYIHSIDGTMADSRRFNGQPLDPEDYTATIEGSGAE